MLTRSMKRTEPADHTPVDGTEFDRPPPTARQQRWDLATGALLTVGMVLSVLLTRSISASDDDALRLSLTESILWSLAVAAPLCLRRRAPVAVLLITSTAFIGMQSRAVIEGTVSSIALFSALYTTGAWARDRRIGTAARTLVVIVMFCWLAYAISATAAAGAQPGDTGAGPLPPALAQILYVTLVNVLFFVGAWYFGDAAFSRARQQDQLHRRTVELARERDESARRAVLAERVRIARELHDVVAHHVSLMGVQAAGARRVLDRDPDLARQALGVVEEAGRDAVEEMGRLLRVLRENDEDESPDPDHEPAGVHSLEGLFAAAAAPGLRVDFTVVGMPAPVPQALGSTVYRIAQEALTNVRKHAGAARVDARLRYLDGALELEVIDDGRGTGLPNTGSGLGLLGMRERADLHAATLEVGPRPEGGYRVRVRAALGRPVDAPNRETSPDREVHRTPHRAAGRSVVLDPAAGDRPAPAKPEPAEPDPRQPDPRQPESRQPESPRPEPRQAVRAEATANPR